MATQLFTTTDGMPAPLVIFPRDYETLSAEDKSLYYPQWQRWDSGWHDCEEPRVTLATQHRFVYRLSTVQPIPVKGEGKIEDANYNSGLTDGAIHGYNLAIYDAIKVLDENKKKLDEHPAMQILITENIYQIQLLKK